MTGSGILDDHRGLYLSCLQLLPACLSPVQLKAAEADQILRACANEDLMDYDQPLRAWCLETVRICGLLGFIDPGAALK